MNPYLAATIGVAIISILPLAGIITLAIKTDTLRRFSHLLVSFSVGALLGNAIFHILPEVYESNVNKAIVSISILSGIILFYLLEQYLQWRHCHEQPCEEHNHPAALMNQIGDTVHNFIDGMLIASTFVLNPSLGLTTIFAVISHEIPQEIADFGVLLHAKWPIKKIILVNIISASAAFIGLFAGFLLSNSVEGFSTIAVAITAGGFIYIACTDLLPDLHEKGAESGLERLVQLICILIGALLFLVI